MKVYLGTDHRGFLLKETLKKKLTAEGVEVIDCGAAQLSPQDDFVDIATIVAQKVSTDSTARGILLCGSGNGVSIAANKISGIRAGVGLNSEQVKASRSDDDINILALAADYISEKEAEAFVQIFLTTEFIPQERFIRRIAKIKELETYA